MPEQELAKQIDYGELLAQCVANKCKGVVSCRDPGTASNSRGLLCETNQQLRVFLSSDFLVLKGQKLIAGGESRHRDEAPGAERGFSRTLKGSDNRRV